jgi:hypothetical protein
MNADKKGGNGNIELLGVVVSGGLQDVAVSMEFVKNKLSRNWN